MENDVNMSLFWYDADGNRTVKEHQGGEAVWVNGTAAGANTDSVSYSIYPNPYISISGDRWTKHYYIGAERIASRTGTISNFSALNSMQNLPAGDGIMDSVVYSTLRHAQEDSVASMYAQLGVPYQVRRTTTRGEGAHLYFPITRTGEDVDGDGSAGTSDDNPQRNHPSTLGDGQVYFYLRDHLGSTLSVTDSVGNYAQQVEYTPWGEVFVERQIGSSGYETPFLFNGKELDEETGLYYYGARYYDPKMSVWYSTDPMEEKYPWVTTYGYCLGNPINAIDSHGSEVVWAFRNGSYSRIIKALNNTKTYNTIFYRFLKNQDNITILHSSDQAYLGYASPSRSNNGYNIYIGNSGFVRNGILTIDATMLAKIIMHEGLHSKYQLINDEGNLSYYPTLNKHMQMQAEQKAKGYQYQGEHETMAEGNIQTFVKGMKEFDVNYGTRHSNDWYNAMAWMGSLREASMAWWDLDVTTRDKYMLIQRNEIQYMNYLKAKATYYGNKNNKNRAAMNKAKQSVNWTLFNQTRNE